MLQRGGCPAGIRQTDRQTDMPGRYGLYSLITEKRAEYDWLDLYVSVHRYAIDCGGGGGGRKAVEVFRKSNKAADTKK